jgi:hypothetical protein
VEYWNIIRKGEEVQRIWVHQTQDYAIEGSEQTLTVNWNKTKEEEEKKCETGHWLLLRSGIVQSVPCNRDHFLICCAYIWVIIIADHPPELSAVVAAEIPSSEAGRNLEKLNFAYQYLYHTWRDILHAVKSYDMGLTSLLPLLRKACYGVLSPLKIHRCRPDLNPRTLGPVAIAITSRSPTTTRVIRRGVK